ncbi:hypothetical protein [Kaistella jeonii]|uniref:Uncharacterized protein n=1 Tax=Kaistella jeonii TaxID=266749 RepID=A0A0C1FNY6_9FLAO|nr:hypothetical protein [Kaistella jeonii]KIA89589.1 hypothetical protein OA86_02855 [Kaistella jeonii]SFB90376.1 hypothetical protein SAMN05421876_103329 [Kaistella jeonii]VEI95798.1 Uncharacterized protein conserved in bacteria [Kaistella jeonii]
MKYVLNLLQEMTPEQKEPLAKILGLKNQSDSEIIKKFSKMLLPVKGFMQEPMNYDQVLKSLSEKNGEVIDFSKGNVIAEKELYLKLFQNEFEKLSQEDKQKIIEELEKAGLNKDQISSLSGITAISIAQLSGFGIYMLASTTLGAITSMLGLTLPFAVYTGMSSAISFIIGPVGFLVMGVMIYRSFRHVKSWEEVQEILNESWKEVVTLFSGDYDRATQCFKYLAASRIVLEQNFNKEKEGNDEEIQSINRRTVEIQDKIETQKLEIKNIQNAVGQKKDLIYRIENEIRERHNEIARVNSEIYSIKEKIGDYEIKKSELNMEKQQGEAELLAIQQNSKTLQERIKNITQ